MKTKLLFLLAFVKKNLSNLFILVFIIFFISTGRFNILKDRFEAWSGKSRGIKVPHISFNYLQTGEKISLEQLKGKEVLLNFWATWCLPCRVEIPEFMDLYSEHKSSGLEIIGVSLDGNGSAPVLAFIRDKKVNYPVVMADSSIMNKFDPVIAVPTSYLIDKNGVVFKKYSGLYLKSTFETDIKNLLQKN
jgi:peroxiredoxin